LSAANFADRLKLLGVGHLIRRGTYLQLCRRQSNFKISLEWLTDEIFHRYMKATFKSLSVDWGALAAVVLTSSGLLICTQPTQFNRVWRSTGLPTFINQLFPEQNKPQISF